MDMLTFAWFVLIGFFIIMYVLLDGFDLGVGILFPLFPDNHDRNVLMSAVLPVWDGNQTWLVLGFASLYGAFPLAFSLLLPSLYLPIFLMVLALLIRGITFEFRLKSKRLRKTWDVLFFASSTIAALCQGLVLGTYVKGYRFLDHQHTILLFELLTPFNITCGIALLFGYALLGSTWVIGKTTGDLQNKMYKIALVCIVAVSFFLVVISIWSPFIDERIRNIWFSPDYMLKLALLPFITGCLIIYFMYALNKKFEYQLYWITIGIFICSFIGFGISTWPYLIPRVVTVTEAAAPHTSQLFMFVGAVILLPVLIAYTSYAYYIFRGKIKDVIGYD